ncbi:MAG TPA: sulfite oxidase [Rubrobacter sp.]|nr:sulfite oxidase [Rubrobacter sp.]
MAGDRTILKPLPPDKFIDYREDGDGEPVGATGDRAVNAETRWEAMAGAGYLTPNELFFVRSHAPTPLVDRTTWELRVVGPGVERELILGYEDLLGLPRVSVLQALECAGNGRRFFEELQGRAAPGTPWRLGAIGVAEWTGVPLREVLLRAGVRESAREVMLEGLDAVRMRRPIPLAKALEEDTLLVFGMNGEELPPDHGFPVRALVPRWAAVASVKWLGEIFVSEEPLYSPWNTDQYVLAGGRYGAEREPVTDQVPKSALELPCPAHLDAGRHTITGRSWSSSGAITLVEYSVDGGQWRPARLLEPNIAGAWVRWHFVWDATPGTHELRVRATDERGNTQPDDATWNELGYLYGGVVRHPAEIL